MKRVILTLAVLISVILPRGAFASLLNLRGEELVQAGGSAIVVNGYSVPTYFDWNNDGRKDLVVSEGPDFFGDGKVRIYLNSGTASNPQFTDYFYAQSDGSDLAVPASGCLGAFGQVSYWNGDSSKDLVVGRSDGKIELFLNTGSDTAPVFDSGSFLEYGPAGSKADIDIGSRATSTVVDWDSDGLKDLVVGALDGRIHVYINEGTASEPDFLTETYVQADGSDLVVPTGRASPMIMDLDGDGLKDVLTGNTEGQLVFYSNVGTNEAPIFSGYTLIEADGLAIDLPGTPRSRPFVCDWNSDGHLDVLIGSYGGQVHLYQGVPEPATICFVGLGVLGLLRRWR
jgi:hypothetical protein